LEHHTVWEENLRERVWAGRYLTIALQELKNESPIQI